MVLFSLKLHPDIEGTVSTLSTSDGGDVAAGKPEIAVSAVRESSLFSRLLTGDTLTPVESVSLGRLIGRAMASLSVRQYLADACSRSAVSVRLYVDGELRGVPWELSFIDEGAVGYLWRHPAVRITRALEGQRPIEPKSHLRVLVASANAGTSKYGPLLKVDDELSAVCRAFARDPRQFEVRQLPHATAARLKQVLSTEAFDILHYAGHADLRPTGGVLVCEGGAEGVASFLRADELSRLVSAAGVKLVFLSGCSTAGVSASIGHQLAARGIPAVLGMQMPVSDTISHLFARSFYQAVADGLPLEEAVIEARVAVAGSGQEWISPVLATQSAGLPIVTAISNGPTGTVGNLPAAANEFVGRSAELELCRRLMSGDRCLVLCGSGGIGKTRLSIEAGRAVAQEYQHGVWQVQLDSLTSSEQVVEAIGLTFGIRPTAEHKLEDRLVEFLSDRNLLLILDNCEHLLEACRDAIRMILRMCPSVRILATSREVLSTGGESVVRVPGLAFPRDLDETTTTLPAGSTIASFDAIQLLAIRAKSADASIELGDAAICAFARIAKRLDGIPLALELAASRVRSFTPEQILERLINDLAWLDLENPGAVPRHRTLRATLDWSYRLLTHEERILFNRLGVFLGGFTLEAAESVAAFHPLTKSDVLTQLPRLVDRSLVVAERVDQRMRFRMLDTCRQYAIEKLSSAGDEAEVRGRHFEHMASFVKGNYSAMFSNEEGQRRAFREFALEQENCLSAIDWALAFPSNFVTTAEMVRRLFYYWHLIRNFPLSKRVIDRVLEQSPSEREPIHLRLLVQSGAASVFMGDRSGLDLTLRANDIAMEIDPELADNDITSWAAECALMSGDYDLALAIYDRQLSYKRERSKDESTAVIMTGVLLIHFRQLERAEAEIAKFLSRAIHLGNRRDVGYCNCYLAQVSVLRGDSNYRSRFAAGVEDLAHVNDLGALGDALPLASAAFLPQSPEVAARVQGFADRLLDEFGSIRDPLLELWARDAIAQTREAIGDTYELLYKDGRTESLANIRESFASLLR